MDVVLVLSVNRISTDCTVHLNKLVTLYNIITNIDKRNRMIFINNMSQSVVQGDIENILQNVRRSNLLQDLSYFLLLNNKGLFRHKNLKLLIVSLGNESFSDKLFNLKTLIEEEDIFTRCFSPFEKSGLSILGEVKDILIENFLLALSEEIKFKDSLFFCPIRCYCHKKVINTGFICPVCLSVFCKRVGICMMCKTRIAIN